MTSACRYSVLCPDTKTGKPHFGKNAVQLTATAYSAFCPNSKTGKSQIEENAVQLTTYIVKGQVTSVCTLHCPNTKTEKSLTSRKECSSAS